MGTPNAEFTKWRKIAEENNIKPKTFKGRVRSGWTYEDAATILVGFRTNIDENVMPRTKEEIEENLFLMYRGGYILTPKQEKYLKDNPSFKEKLNRYSEERAENKQKVLYSPYFEVESPRDTPKEGWIASEHLKQLIKDTGLSYSGFGKTVGISASPLCSTMNRSIFASERTIRILTDHFGVAREEIFVRGDETMLRERKERRGRHRD